MAVEFALVAPILMLLILGLLQFGIWYHAQQVVIGAAQEAARLAATEGSNEEAAKRRASELLSAGLGGLAKAPTATVATGPQRATVTVSATLDGLLPLPGLGEFQLSAQASAYRERFRPAGEL